MATVTFGTSSASTSNTTSYALGTFTPATNDLLVVFAGFTASVEPGAAFTATDDQSGTYTKILVAERAASAHSLVLFVRDQLVSSAVGHIVTVDCTGDAATGCIIVGYRVAGMTKTGSAAVLQSAKQDNQSSGGTPAPSFASAANTNNPTLGAVDLTTATTPLVTEPSGWTEGQEDTHGAPNHGTESVFRDSGFTGTTITWGSTVSATFCSLIAELDTSTPSARDPGRLSLLGVGG